MSVASIAVTIPTVGKVVIPLATVGTLANRPSPTGTQGFYYATDTTTLYLDIGTAWVAV